MSDSPSEPPAPPNQPTGQLRCGGCGAKITSDQKTCTYCGTHCDTSSVPASAFCQKCGYALSGLKVTDLCPECAHPVVESMRVQGVASPVFHTLLNPEAEIPSSVPDSALCRGCGYVLAGLQVTDKCPECGRPVLESIRGDLLKFCDPSYLKSLHRGVVLIETSFIMSIVGGILFIAIGAIAGAALGFNPSPLLSLLGIVPTIISIAGWMLLSIPDPGVHIEDKGDKPRKTLRIAVIISTVASMISAVLSAISPSTANQFSPGSLSGPVTGNSILEVLAGLALLASLIAFVVQYFAAMKYLAWIAPRIPNFEVATKMKKQTWTIALLVVPGCMCFYIGPLVALVLFYNLLDKFRIDFKRIRIEATGTAALWDDLVPARKSQDSDSNPPSQPPNAP